MTEWPYERLAHMASALDTARGFQDGEHALEAIAQISVVAELLPDVMTDLAILASRAGYTNKRIAAMMNVPPSTLRGLREEARQ